MGAESAPQQHYNPIEGAHDPSIDGAAHLDALRAERAGWDELAAQAHAPTPVSAPNAAEAGKPDARDGWAQDDEDVWGSRSNSHLPGITLGHEDHRSDDW
jgi:hypothetical protein